MSEKKFIPSFTPSEKSDYSHHVPNLELPWKRWGRDYIVLKSHFDDEEGKKCSAYVGYCFSDPNKPWWHLTYVGVNNYEKVVVVDSKEDVLHRLSELGVITDTKDFSTDQLPNLKDSFKGAIRTAIDPKFFQSNRVFMNAHFSRY